MIRINLLKVEKKEVEAAPPLAETEVKTKKKAPGGNLIIVFALILLAALAFLQKKALNNERGLLDKAKEEKQKLESVLTKLDQVEEQRLFLQKKIDLINQLQARKSGAVRIMEELSASLPDWVWLTEVSVNPQTIQIKGKALSNIQISDYMRNLERSGLLDAFSLLDSTQKTQGANQYLEFSISANRVAPKPPTAQGQTANRPKTREGR